MSDATIIYYTSNREDPLFESRVQEKLLEVCGKLPIISVSQTPISLGKNICVGDVGTSGFNMFRQVEIALTAATTPFIISAEADCLYPPDYFKFRPKSLTKCFRDSNLYVMPDHRNFFFKKSEGATHAQIIGREFYLKTLKRLFKGAPQWSTEEKNFPKERLKQEDVFLPHEIEYWESENPVFQVKTHRSMRYYTRSDRNPIHELLYWGKGSEVRAHLMKDIEEKWSS